jgi:hypothetical protein
MLRRKITTCDITCIAKACKKVDKCTNCPFSRKFADNFKGVLLTLQIAGGCWVQNIRNNKESEFIKFYLECKNHRG